MTYLLQIASKICQGRKTPEGDGRGEGTGENEFVLDDVLDKVVQDDENTERTGYWSVMEAAQRRVSAPSLQQRNSREWRVETEYRGLRWGRS